MGKKAFFRLAMAAIGLGAVVFAVASPVRAAETQYIWSASSGLANQSTEALRSGRHAHSIRFAKDLLRSKTHPANHLIARHNLCLAYGALGQADQAKPFCEQALAAQARYGIVERDGRLVASAADATEAGAPTLAAAVRANIARAQGGAVAEGR